MTRRRLEALFAGFASALAADTGGLAAEAVPRSCAPRASHADAEDVRLVAGVDEAGRGPLAGPVVAAAVILDPARPIAGLRDSKLLSAAARERLAVEIREYALAWAAGDADVAEIDALNILQATMLAMQRAVARSRSRPLPRGSTATAVRSSPAPCARSSRAIATSP